MNKSIKHCPKCGGEMKDQAVHDKVIPVCADDSCAHQTWPCMYPAVVTAIRDAEGRVLVIERANEPQKGKLDWPGGFVDHGELPEVAAVREAMEELGAEIELVDFLGFGIDEYDYQGEVQLNLVAGYVARLKNGSELKVDPNEVKNEKWVDPSELNDKDFAFTSGKVFLEKLS